MCRDPSCCYPTVIYRPTEPQPRRPKPTGGKSPPLYAVLERLKPTPVVALNHAVAMSEGIERGLARTDRLGASGELDEYFLFHAARAGLLRRFDRGKQAAEAYRRALALATNQVEREYLMRRLASV